MVSNNSAVAIGAFFDFDETLLDTESSRLGFKYLWERRLVSRGFIAKVMIANFFYKRHWMSDEKIAAIMLKFYQGKNLQDFEQGAPDFYREHLKPHLAPNIMRRVVHHQQEGHVLVLISGSIRYLLEPVAKDLGFHHLLCTDLEVGADGLLTGRSQGPLCLDSTKRVLAERLAADANIDLSSSYAYGNHQADLPLLESVGHPHVVEPTRPLKDVAIEKHWPLLTYR
jgi:HAD superfamily hydrolase (TIGR01490 family)